MVDLRTQNADQLNDQREKRRPRAAFKTYKGEAIQCKSQNRHVERAPCFYLGSHNERAARLDAVRGHKTCQNTIIRHGTLD